MRQRRKSSSGTSNLKEVPFNAKDLCAIIEMSAKSSVSRLEIGDLKIFFESEGPKDSVSIGHLQEEQIPPSEIILTDDQKFELEKAHHEQLATLDPAAYEQQEIDRLMDTFGELDGRDGIR